MEGPWMNTGYLFRHNTGLSRGFEEEASRACRAREPVAWNFKIAVYTQTTDIPAEDGTTAT